MDFSQPLDDQPWFIKAVVWVGVPTAAFAVLLWFVLGNMSEKLDRMSNDMSEVAKHLSTETQQSWVIQGTLSRICINTARTDADRLACVSIPRRD